MTFVTKLFENAPFRSSTAMRFIEATMIPIASLGYALDIKRYQSHLLKAIFFSQFYFEQER